MKKQWFISDPHFFHEAFLREGRIAIRPFDTLKEMHERIIEGWNSVVKPGDKVLVQGDITLIKKPTLDEWNELIRVHEALNGEKELLFGNHDHLKLTDYVMLGYNDIRAYRKDHGIAFSHIPIHPAQGYRFKANVHGHTHEMNVNRVIANGTPLAVSEPDPFYINVCMEPLNYTPISFDEIMARVEKVSNVRN